MNMLRWVPLLKSKNKSRNRLGFEENVNRIMPEEVHVSAKILKI